METREHSAWAVAAALLLVENDWRNMHWLAQQVEETRLSNLAQQGGSYPWKTLRTATASQHADVFEPYGGKSGLYRIRDAEFALNKPQVRFALHAIWRIWLNEYETLFGNTARWSRWYVSPTNPHLNIELHNRMRELERLERRLIRIRHLLYGGYGQSPVDFGRGISAST